MKNQYSLRWKILRYLLAFAFAMIALVWLFQTVFLESFYESIRMRNMKTVVTEVKSSLHEADLQERIDTLSADNEVCIRVVKLNGFSFPSEKQYVSQSRGACAVARLSDEQIVDYWMKAKGLDGGAYTVKSVEVIPITDPQSFKMTFKETGNQDFLLAQNVSFEKMEALVLISSRISPINSTIETLRVQLVGISVIISLMAVGLAAFMNAKVTAPLEEITGSARRLADGHEDVKFAASGYHEITELNEALNYALEKMKEVDQFRRDLIANVSHDLRTPLTMIEGYAEMMRDLPDENTPENAQVIMNEAHRLSLLVNDLLDLNALEENKVVLNVELLNISELMQNVVERYRKYTSLQGFEIVLDAESSCTAMADEQRFLQIVYNFINNAIQYSHNIRRIEIRVMSNMDFVRIEIQDFGKGIERSQLNRIWERYYKIDKQHVRAQNGSGIGLSICRHLLELHGAKYGVVSQVDKGTTFWFELPKQLS